MTDMINKAQAEDKFHSGLVAGTQAIEALRATGQFDIRSEEHTSELQSH